MRKLNRLDIIMIITLACSTLGWVLVVLWALYLQ